MQIYQAKQAKNQFGQMIHNAQHEPLIIERYGQEVIAIISKREFDRLRAVEEAMLEYQAAIAKREGFIGEKESDDLITELLDA